VLLLGWRLMSVSCTARGMGSGFALFLRSGSVAVSGYWQQLHSAQCSMDPAAPPDVPCFACVVAMQECPLQRFNRAMGRMHSEGERGACCCSCCCLLPTTCSATLAVGNAQRRGTWTLLLHVQHGRAAANLKQGRRRAAASSGCCR
jgi:hypothetical protein